MGVQLNAINIMQWMSDYIPYETKIVISDSYFI